MKNIFLHISILIGFSSFSQVVYPGTPTIGTAEIVFDYSSSKCHLDDLPDVPARAFRDANGKINLIASHYTNWRMIGNSFTTLIKDCNSIMSSDEDSDPAKFNNKEWINATYTTDGKTIHALIHNEYVPCGNWNNCWYNSITYATSLDSGRTYSHISAPNHLVAASPYQSPYPSTHSPFGIFGGSNIIEKDGYYYKLVQIEAYQEQEYGVGVLRTNDISDPKSWRGWDGEGFNVVFVNPYIETGYNVSDKLLAPVSRNRIGKMCASLTYNTYFEKFMVVDYTVGEINGQLKYGFYYSLSDDLINWSTKRIIYQFNSSTWSAGGNNYPSIIDHDDQTRNFERPDETVYLYFTKWNSGLDRDLMRIPVTFKKEVVTKFTVNSTNNGGDATPGDGICRTTGNVCTLRAAIEEANARPPYNGYDTIPITIQFGISGSGVKTIKPNSYLPEVFFPLTIDGFSQTGGIANTNDFDKGLNCVVTVELNAEDGGAHALAFHCGKNTIKGMSIYNGNIDFLYEEGYSKSEGNNTIEGCYIGIGSDGLTPYFGAININNQNNNLIGGRNNASRNLIAGGISIKNSKNNIIKNNYIGSDFTGMNSSGANQHGIFLDDSTEFTIIGGTEMMDKNLISGNNRGIFLSGANCKNNEIYANYIGIAVDGLSALGNNGAGIFLENFTNFNIIGKPEFGNIITDNSNDEAGIWIDESSNNTIHSNFIGTNASKAERLGNGAIGNISAGIILTGNGSKDNKIGGLTENEGNIIAYNSGHGIAFFSDAGEGNSIFSNLIFENEGMAIDLGGDNYLNPNDDLDIDLGPNRNQNFPDLISAHTNSSQIQIEGTLRSIPNTTFYIQYFISSNCDENENGEGKIYLGLDYVTTNSLGIGNINSNLKKNVEPGNQISALATDASNNTSEFSTCVVVDLLTSSSYIQSEQVKVYPTFTSDFVHVITNEDCTYTILDQNGKIVKQENAINSKKTIDIQHLSPGVYYLKINGKNNLTCKKIIKL